MGPPAAAFDRAAAALKAARAANDRAAMARAAAEGMAATAAATDSVVAMRPDKAATLGLLRAIAGRTELAGELGEEGIAAQRDALFALYSGYASSPDKPGDAAAVVKLIEEGLYPERFDAAGYVEALGKVREHVRPAVPAGGR
jgi:hypothetical protein